MQTLLSPQKQNQKSSVSAVQPVTPEHYSKNLLDLHEANFLLCIYQAGQWFSN